MLRAASDETPRVAVVLGSGLNELADRLIARRSCPYDRIPHFPHTTVAGHEGKVLLGMLGGVPAVVFQGRFHYYEGHDLETVTFPIRVIQQLGVSTLGLDRGHGGYPLRAASGQPCALDRSPQPDRLESTSRPQRFDGWELAFPT